MLGTKGESDSNTFRPLFAIEIAEFCREELDFSCIYIFWLPRDEGGSNLHDMETTSTALEVGKVIGGLIGCFFFLAIPAFFVFSLVMAITKKSRNWTIATVIMGTLGFLLLAGVFGVGLYTGWQKAQEERVARDFNTSDGLAVVTGGSGWTNLDLDAEDATLSIGNLFAEEYLIVISEEKSAFDSDFGVKDFADVAVEQTVNLLEGAIVKEPIATTVNGLPGYVREISGEIEGIDITYFNTYVEGRTHFHQILTWTLTRKKGKALPKLQAAAESFRELPPIVP